MLDGFFLAGGSIPATTESGEYNSFLVLLSFVVATLGTYVALTLAAAMTAATTRKNKNILHAFGAFALGSGIWSMHFIGMIAYKMSMTIDYDPLLTGLSMVIAIAVAYVVLGFTRSLQLSFAKIIGGACLLGFAICAMHYIGMAAMLMDADLRYQPVPFLLSFVIAITASASALWIFFTLCRRKQGRAEHACRVLAASVMGVAVCGTHYTGIHAAIFIPHAICHHDTSQNFNAIITAIIGICSAIFGIALAFSFFSNEQRNIRDPTALPFPIRLLVLSLVLTMVVAFWRTGSSLYIDYLIKNNIQQDMRAISIGNQVSYLDVIVAHDLKAYTLSRDPKWSLAYQENAKALDNLIAELTTTAYQIRQRGSKNITDFYTLAQNLDRHTVSYLVDTEKRALDLAQQNNIDQAQKTLVSDSYMSARQEYSGKLHSLGDSTNGALAYDMRSITRTTSYTLYLGVVVIFLLPTTWFFSFQSLRKWRAELEATRINLLANEEALQQALYRTKLSEAEAIKAREAAEMANAAKSDFLANMSHELRTPLNSILGMLYLLSAKDLTKEKRQMVDTATTASSNLLNIVNDILDLSKIEAGGMQLERIGINLNSIFSSILLTLGHLAKEKNVILNWRPAVETFPFVLGDSTRLIRILTNLISNAIKYTRKGGLVDVSASYEKTSETTIIFRCDITDTGIGISLEKTGRIFDKFVQADTSTTRQYGGTGLGLAITKQLVELMCGTIGVNSEFGLGSNFWFTIPFEITDHADRDHGQSKKTRSCGIIPAHRARVLVAEDNAMNQILITKVLKQFGIERFEIVDNGADVLRRHQEVSWDIILMDGHMPIKNGYDTSMEIRELEQDTDQHTPIIAMTADAMIGDREKCFKAGMDDYISKPISITDLKDILGQWIRFTPALVTADKPVPSSLEDGCLDLTLLRTNTDNDKSMQRMLVEALTHQIDEKLVLFSETGPHGTVSEWKEIAHLIKGGAGDIGADQLAELCRKAQNFNGTDEELAIFFPQILQEYARVKDMLRGEQLLN